MNLKRIVVGRGEANCYFLWDSVKNLVIVDPGDNSDLLIEIIEKEELKPNLIILTHYHYDHILAVKDLKNKFKIPVYIHENGLKGLKNSNINLSALRPVAETSIEANRGLKDGEILNVGEMELEIIYTPGHTNSDICIKCEDIILTGDILFKNSVGRSDFVESSYENLKKSVLNKLMSLDDNLAVYPGHYDASTIGQERKYNPKIKQMLNEN